MSVVGQHFRQEFINRVDEAVVFHPLDQQHIRGIADIQLSGLKARLADLGLTFDISDEVMEKLADAGLTQFMVRGRSSVLYNGNEEPFVTAYIGR